MSKVVPPKRRVAYASCASEIISDILLKFAEEVFSGDIQKIRKTS